MLHLFTTHLNAVEFPQGRGNNAIGSASKFAQANEVIACVINAAVDNGIHPVVEIRLALKDEKQKCAHGHMATSQRKGVARVRLRQIGWQLEALAVHGIRRLPQGLGKSLDTLAEFWELASRRRLDETAGAGKIPKRHSLQNRLLRMQTVVIHHIAQSHTEANRIKTHLID